MQRRSIGLDEATPRQRELARELREASAAPGKLVSVVLGDGSWDVRLITEEGGRHWLTRPVDPAIRADSLGYDRMRILLSWVGGSIPDVQCGEVSGMLWYRRPYAQKTGSDHTVFVQVSALTILRSATEILEHYHVASQVHGHVAPSNILVHSDSFIELADPGFALYCPSARLGRSCLAPEVGGSGPLTSAVDIYGLGMTGRKLFGGAKPCEELERLLEIMVSPDISRRPSIHWVLGVLRELREDQVFSQGRSGGGKILPRSSGVVRSSQQIAPTDVPSPVSGQVSQEGQSDRVGSSAAIAPSIPSTYPVGSQPPGGTPSFESAGSLGFQHRTPSLLPIIAALIIVGAAIWWVVRPKSESLPYDAYWISGQPSYMRAVAEAAIYDEDPNAQLAIFDAARRGFANNAILSEVLTVAVDPRWEAEMTDEDRTLVLKVAVGSLLGGGLAVTIDDSIHPGVLFAILARSPLDGSGRELQMIPPQRLQGLAAPIGPVFKGLNDLGIRSVEEPEAKAAAHLLVGDFRQPVLDTFLSPYGDEGRLLAKLDIMKEAILKDDKLCLGMAGSVVPRSAMIRSLLDWFSQDDTDIWKDVQPQTRFAISLGVLPPNLSYEQLVDLLAFNRPSVREAAGLRLLRDESFTVIRDIVPVLVGPGNTLNRLQVQSLAGALQTSGRDQLMLVHGWLKTNPPPFLVAQLLLARNGKDGSDAFNLEAARYLMQAKGVKLPREMLAALSTHSESMARAYVYAALKPSLQDDRVILEAALAKESNPRLKEQLTASLR